MPSPPPTQLLRRVAAALDAPQQSFVVIGAHGFALEGELNDHPELVRMATTRRWHSVLLVEASPPLAASLQERLQRGSPFSNGSRVIVSSTAVCPSRMQSSEFPFFTVMAKLSTGDDRLPGFTDQFGSFSRAQVDLQLKDISKYMQRKVGIGNNWTLDAVNQTVASHQVPCVSIAELLRRHSLPSPAVLLIDTEGFDCDIVAEQLDGCQIAPNILQFEHTWCPPEARARAERRVRSGLPTCDGRASARRYSEAFSPRWSDTAFYSTEPTPRAAAATRADAPLGSPPPSPPQSPPACDAEAGSWAATTALEYYAGYACPLWNNSLVYARTEQRFRCDRYGDAPFRRFDPSCAAASSGSDGGGGGGGSAASSSLHLVRENTTVWFIGDSISRQHALAFACRLHHDAHRKRRAPSAEPSSPAEPTLGQTPLSLTAHPTWAALANPPALPVSSANRHQPPFCMTVARRSACFVSSWRRASDSAARLVEHGVVSRGDLVLLNDGLHFPDALAITVAAETAQAFANASSPLAVAAARGGVRFAWRETSPQAFGFLGNGSYHSGSYAKTRAHSACTPVVRTARPAWYVDAHARMAAVGLAVMPTWRATVTQWDTHLARRTPHMTAHSGILDCTHFCEPSGVMEHWNDALLRLLAGWKRV